MLGIVAVECDQYDVIALVGGMRPCGGTVVEQRVELAVRSDLDRLVLHGVLVETDNVRLLDHQLLDGERSAGPRQCVVGIQVGRLGLDV